MLGHGIDLNIKITKMEKVVFNFEKLTVYQKALDFIDAADALIDTFPQKERYRLSSQYGRAALSIALNISEGHGDTNKQFNRYLNMAWDSLKECVTCSTVATRKKYISQEQNDNTRKQLQEIAKMIMGLKKSLKLD